MSVYCRLLLGSNAGHTHIGLQSWPSDYKRISIWNLSTWWQPLTWRGGCSQLLNHRVHQIHLSQWTVPVRVLVYVGKAMVWNINMVYWDYCIENAGPQIFSPIRWIKISDHGTVEPNLLSHRLQYSIFHSRWCKTVHWIYRDFFKSRSHIYSSFFWNWHVCDFFGRFFLLCMGPVMGSCEYSDGPLGSIEGRKCFD
jgi:hypothetical protein